MPLLYYTSILLTYEEGTTKDKMAGANVFIIQRFHCIILILKLHPLTPHTQNTTQKTSELNKKHDSQSLIIGFFYAHLN